MFSSLQVEAVPRLALRGPPPYHPPLFIAKPANTGFSMLQEMRKYAKSWVSSLFLGALALSFAIWGIADIFRGNTDTTVFAVGSTQVPVEMYQRDYHNALRSLGTAVQPDQARVLGQQVLDRMMLTTALDNLAERLGL